MVDVGGGVEQHGQQIALDVAHGRGVGFQAVHDILDVHAVDLEQPFLDQRSREIVPGNRQSRARRAERSPPKFRNSRCSVLPDSGTFGPDPPPSLLPSVQAERGRGWIDG